jgi:hypothetical protein
MTELFDLPGSSFCIREEARIVVLAARRNDQ